MICTEVDQNTLESYSWSMSLLLLLDLHMCVDLFWHDGMTEIATHVDNAHLTVLFKSVVYILFQAYSVCFALQTWLSSLTTLNTPCTVGLLGSSGDSWLGLEARPIYYQFKSADTLFYKSSQRSNVKQEKHCKIKTNRNNEKGALMCEMDCGLVVTSGLAVVSGVTRINQRACILF